MMNISKILRLSAICLAVSLLLCGCRKPNEIDTTSSGAETGIQSQLQISVSSSRPKEETSVPSSITSSEADSEVFSSTSSLVSSIQIEKKEVKAEGIDVSKWQGKIDWKKVKAQGIDFAIIRIGQRAENGKIIKDDCADYNIQQADKNGILIGVYFFSAAVSAQEAIQEAQWVADAVKGYPISYPVVWDCEGFSESDSRMYSLTNSQRTLNALSFLNEIKALGYEAMFYGSASELSGSLKWDTSKIEESFKIWLASYPQITYPEITTPNYSGRYDMWQYTNKGSVSGIKDGVDKVVSYFSVKKAAPKTNVTVPEVSAPKENDGIYTSVNEKITAKDVVNLRDSASTGGNIVGTLKNGDILTRIAIGENGWSRLEYGEKTVYAVSSYLTTELNYKTPEPEPPSDGFRQVNETVTAKDKTNLRSVPDSSDASTVVYTLKNGETAVRIGISDSGWSKLEYNGKTLYAVSSYLTTDLNYKADTESGNDSSSQLKTTFTDVNEQVTAKSETNLRTLPSVTDSEIVHTLKNGEYVTRIGVSDNGWSRLEYNGKTVYAVSSYLTK